MNPSFREHKVTWPSYREYELDRRTEYRGTILDGIMELDVCTHHHRTPEAAIRCAKKMIRQKTVGTDQ